MKYLVLVLVVGVVLWLARSARRREEREAEAARPAAAPAPAAGRAAAAEGTPLLACAHCGLHLPQGESWPGRGGVYCSEAHRRIAEGRARGD
ncbi:PP0621 family protein [Piscinibacter sakaiensis]|uniref:Putative exported protein n=1 Tax=Piscinibacter sakaiensis TaxID=1547922 RepID=A0A0K8NXZ5_PISS1|nr:PP0621 family protein [Piscinibacter sakaiensis]GAP35256.1 putative exported protein [Piscinibacter sakaiensis]